jgi:ankyrin repeat protein
MSTGVTALLRAAQRGDIESVRTALQQADVTVNSAAPSSGNTALHEAAQRDHAAVVRELLALGASVNAVNGQGATALHKALSRPSAACASESVRVLLESGADVTLADRHGDSALAKAVRQNRLDDLRLLLAALPADAQANAADGATLLHVAAVDSSLPPIIDALLERFGAAAVDAHDACRRSPLLYAGLKRDGRDFAKLEALRANWKLLVQRGASLVDADGAPLLNRADISSEFAAFLLEQAAPSADPASVLTAVGAHAQALSIWPLQRIAAAAGAQSGVTAADADAMLNARSTEQSDPSNVTLLHALALEPEASEAAVLVVDAIAKFRAEKLSAFALLATRCANRRTALHNAAMRGSLDVVRALLRAVPQHANLLAARDAAGLTPCDVAATHGRVDVWRTLVEHVALPAAYPGDAVRLSAFAGDAPPLLVLAAAANDVATIEKLLQLGVDAGGENPALDEYSDESGTALHVAARRNETAPALAALLAHVGQRDARDALVNKPAAGLQNQTPLHIAVGQGALECVRLLRRSGANPEARDALDRSAFDLAMMGTDERVMQALTE